MASKSILIVIVFALLGSLFAGMWYLNRTACETSEYWGKICYKFKWGRPMIMTVDRDLNGTPEIQALFLADDPRNSHTYPDEIWEDLDGDGQFDRHYTMKNGKIKKLDLDTNKDGIYDQELNGQEAKEFLNTYPWSGV